MEKIEILVVDDEATGNKDENDRATTYNNLKSHKINGQSIAIEYATGLEDASSKIEQNRYHFMLIDVVLTKWGDENGEGFKLLVSEASKRMPIGVISSQWDGSSMAYIRQIFQNDVEEVDIRLLFKWSEFENRQTLNLIILQLHKELCRYYQIETLDRNPSESLRILHLSDLHIGSDKQTLQGANLRRVADQIRKRWKEGPDFIIVTGDVANTGNPKEYIEAEKWFKEFGNYLNFEIPSKRLLIVPGNHDFSIPIAQSRRVFINADNQIRKNKSSDSGLADFALSPFQKFAKKITKKNNNWEKTPFSHWFETGFYNHGLFFSGINTVPQADENNWPERKILERDLIEIEDKIKENSKIHSLVHILLTHHSPVRADADEPISNDQDFCNHLIETIASPHLIFHGHEHKRGTHLYNGKVLIITAPTPTNRGKRPPDNARGFTMIELPRKGYKIIGANVYPYILDNNRWSQIEPENYKFERNVFHKI